MWIERVFQVECIKLPTHVLQSSSKCKPVSGVFWWLHCNSLLVTFEDRRPLGGSNVCFRVECKARNGCSQVPRPAASRWIERVFQVECIKLATHVLQSSSKCKPVSRSTSALPLVVLGPQYYRNNWDVGASSRSCSSCTV